MALNLAASSKTSTSTYEMAFTLSYSQNTSEYEYTLVTITPYLRNTAGVWRPQHVWGVAFAVDNMHRQTYNYNGPKTNMHNYLPNDTAKPGVVGDGKLYMTANQWYQWGSPYTHKVKNDGGVHNFGLMMWCGTNPRYCPAKDTYLWADAKMPLYTIMPSAPTGVSESYNEDTRIIEYKWTDADQSTDANSKTAFKILHRNMYDANNNIVKSGFFNIDGRARDKLYYTDMVSGLVKEQVPDNVVLIEWELENISVTDNDAGIPARYVTIDSDCKVWMKINGGWVKTIPWVKGKDGVWHKATKSYINKDGTWKRTVT